MSNVIESSKGKEPRRKLKSLAGTFSRSPLPHYHTLDREQGASYAPLHFARSLLRSVALRSETPWLVSLRSQSPCPLSRYPPKIQYPAIPCTRKNRHKDKLPSSSARARGPRTPLAPCLRRSARARCTLISLIINRLSNFRAPYEGGASGPPPPNAPPSYVARIGSYFIIR